MRLNVFLNPLKMKKALLLIFIFLNAYQIFAQSSPDYFKPLESCGKGERVKVASDINYKTIVLLDTAASVVALDQLKNFADSKSDRKLQVLEILLRGEFYFNTLNNECISYFEKGLQQATKHDYKDLQAQAYHDLGLQFYRDSKYNSAFEYLLKGNYLMNDIGYHDYPSIGRYLFDLANVYYQFADFAKSRKLLEEATKYPYPNSLYAIKISNTLGLCNRELGNFEAAKENFIQTATLSKAANESVWVGIATGNLGSIYYKLKQYNEAIPLLKVDYNLSIQSKELQSASTTLCVLADVYLNMNMLDSAGYYLAKATELVRVVNDPANYRSYYNIKAAYSKIKGDYATAFKSLDSANFYNSQLLKRDFANIKAKAEQKSAVERYLADLKLIESKKELQVIMRNGIIGALLLVLVIVVLILNKLRLTRKHDKEMLTNATDQLNLYLESIKEKNNLIDRFEGQLQDISLQHSHQETIEQLQNSTILTEDDWNEFRRLFEKVHTNFFVKLKQKYPTLTQSEVRLMALIKLNLARKEMADMLGISPDSVKKTRQRIKKRIELPDNMDLEEIVFNI